VMAIWPIWFKATMTDTSLAAISLAMLINCTRAVKQ
jgi:hypothetical protein